MTMLTSRALGIYRTLCVLVYQFVMVIGDKQRCFWARWLWRSHDGAETGKKDTQLYSDKDAHIFLCDVNSASDHNSKWTALRIAWVWCSSLISKIGMSLMSVRPGKIQMQNNGEPMFCISLFHPNNLCQNQALFPCERNSFKEVRKPGKIQTKWIHTPPL